MIDTIRISLDVTIGDFTVNCSRTLDADEWRNKPVAMLEAELSQILVQILQPTVAAYDAQRAASAERSIAT
jgi:hypothetical protein